MLACGTVMTEGFQVPMVAYALGVRTVRVEGPPAAIGPVGAGPQSHPADPQHASAPQLPYVSSWPAVHYVERDSHGPFDLFTHCDDSRS